MRRGPSGRHRPAVVFIAWGAVGGRSIEIAEALGGRALSLFPPTDAKRLPAALRYLVGAAQTTRYLVGARPDAVIVTNPPIFPGLLVWCYAVLRRGKARVVLDSHPGSFGLQGDALGARMVPLHRFLASRVDGVMVTSPELADLVSSWGGRPFLLHEAPGRWVLATDRPPGPRPQVLVVGRFAGDEPIDAVVDAARLLPGVDFAITGRIEDAPSGMIDSAPQNVRFVGFMPSSVYAEAVEAADLVLTLTTEPTSVMRAAYEATYAGKVVVLSDWPLSRSLFPAAIAVLHDPSAIADGVEVAIREHDRLRAAAGGARQNQLDRWGAQLDELRRRLDLPSGDR